MMNRTVSVLLAGGLVIFLGAAALLIPAFANEDEQEKGIFTHSYERAKRQAEYVGYANQRVVDMVALGESPGRVSAAIAGKDGDFLEKVCGKQNTNTPEGIQKCTNMLREFRNDIFRHSRSQSAIADSVDSFARYIDNLEGPEGFDLLKDLEYINARVAARPSEGGNGVDIQPSGVSPANEELQEGSSVVAAMLNAEEGSYENSVVGFDFRMGSAVSALPSGGRSAGGIDYNVDNVAIGVSPGGLSAAVITYNDDSCEEEGEVSLFGQCVNFNTNYAGEECRFAAGGYVKGCIYGQMSLGQRPNRHATDIPLANPITLLNDWWTEQANSIRQTNTQITENQNHFFALSKTHSPKHPPSIGISVETQPAAAVPEPAPTDFVPIIKRAYEEVSTSYGACPEGAEGCPLETEHDCQTLLNFNASQLMAAGVTEGGSMTQRAEACQQEIAALAAMRTPTVPDVLSNLPSVNAKIVGSQLAAATGQIARGYASYQQAIAAVSTAQTERASLACQVAG